jgi:hypothetical protein
MIYWYRIARALGIVSERRRAQRRVIPSPPLSGVLDQRSQFGFHADRRKDVAEANAAERKDAQQERFNAQIQARQ